MKPGFKTTEFWVSIAVILLSTGAGVLCIIYGKNALEKAEAIVPLIIAYLKAHGYNMGRVRQKIENIIKEQMGLGTPCPPVVITPPPAPVVITPTVIPPPPDDEKQTVSVCTKIMKNSTAVTTIIK